MNPFLRVFGFTRRKCNFRLALFLCSCLREDGLGLLGRVGVSVLQSALVLSLALFQGGARGAELADTVAGVKPSVVSLGTRSGDAQPRLRGNGFVVAGGNHVVTTSGVVGTDGKRPGAKQLLVLIPSGGTQVQGRPTRRVACDEEHGLCLLRFEGPSLPSLRIGRSADVREGEVHAYTGYPTAGVLGLYAVTRRGIVAAISPNVVPPLSSKLLNRDVLEKLVRPYPVFQLDMAAFPGNDGSPLYEPDTGRVVGVVNSDFVKVTKEVSLSGNSAISYAIPVDHVRRLLDQNRLPY